MPLRIGSKLNPKALKLAEAAYEKGKEDQDAGTPNALDRLAAKLRTALGRETANVIEIGKLLIESRKLLAKQHGEWQPWLEKNFDLSYRTAIRYVSAAEYVERESKSDTVSLFANLSPTVLYGLAAGHYNEQEEAAILAAARKGRVDQEGALAICKALAPPDDDDTDDADDQEDGGEDDAEKAPPDPEIEAILAAGTDPAVPPPAPIPPPINFALRDFDDAVGTLKRLMTKSAAQFGDTAHTVEDLKKVRDFIRAVADELSKLAEAS
jgi:hypothetical protein